MGEQTPTPERIVNEKLSVILHVRLLLCGTYATNGHSSILHNVRASFPINIQLLVTEPDTTSHIENERRFYHLIKAQLNKQQMQRRVNKMHDN